MPTSRYVPITTHSDLASVGRGVKFITWWKGHHGVQGRHLASKPEVRWRLHEKGKGAQPRRRLSALIGARIERGGGNLDGDDAFVRWPGMIEADSIVGDMIHVAGLLTSLARFCGATDKIPTDRIIDGVDQSALMLEGETHGRRDHVFVYSINSLKAVVKEQYKLYVPGPGESPIIAKFYDLFRDTREEYPVSTEVGAWGGQEFVRIIQRHMMRKQKYPHEGPARGRPYDGIENLRPETIAAVEAFLMKQSAPMK